MEEPDTKTIYTYGLLLLLFVLSPILSLFASSIIEMYDLRPCHDETVPIHGSVRVSCHRDAQLVVTNDAYVCQCQRSR